MADLPRPFRRRFASSAVLAAAIASACAPGCYSAGSGTAPPPNIFYFPVGLAVSKGGNVLYVANSDFDLQWNGGTLQSYDLHAIRQDAVAVMANPANPAAIHGRFVYPPAPGCPNNPPLQKPDGSGQRQVPGETCAPPVDSTAYVRDSAIIGAFATDVQLSVAKAPDTATTDRLFVPVRGDASVTWADVALDLQTGPPDFASSNASNYAPFSLQCGTRVDGRCDTAHHAGNDGNEPGNTRNITMPGEPFGLAQSEDGSVLVVTHQNDTKTSLLSTGISGDLSQTKVPPSLQFVLDGLPQGGNGIAAVPHDALAFPDCGGTTPTQCPPRPAFLETSRAVAEIDLLRYYQDEGYAQQSGSSLYRPFLAREQAWPLTANASGTDSRGIAIDATPRRSCELALMASGKATPQDLEACARKPARVFIANRTPESLLIGEVGEPSLLGDPAYDPDRLVMYANKPLTLGPSSVYLAPIIDATGHYAIRVFIVCFDSASIIVYDPDADQVENVIQVGQGPFALAFDPWSFDAVASHAAAENDRTGIVDANGAPIHAYRFAYVASFTKSFVQLIDLDGSRQDKSTYQTVVFTLGQPTLPKGTQ